MQKRWFRMLPMSLWQEYMPRSTFWTILCDIQFLEVWDVRSPQALDPFALVASWLPLSTLFATSSTSLVWTATMASWAASSLLSNALLAASKGYLYVSLFVCWRHLLLHTYVIRNGSPITHLVVLPSLDKLLFHQLDVHGTWSRTVVLMLWSMIHWSATSCLWASVSRLYNECTMAHSLWTMNRRLTGRCAMLTFGFHLSRGLQACIQPNRRNDTRRCSRVLPYRRVHVFQHCHSHLQWRCNYFCLLGRGSWCSSKVREI